MRTPEFSVYDGGDQFVYANTVFYRQKQLGHGSFSDVFLFSTKDKTQFCAVKCEKNYLQRYPFGQLFDNEAKWYQKVYGVGVLSGDPATCCAPHYILIPYFRGELLQCKSFATVKELFFHWIWTAIAIRQLHQKHQAIHGDLKLDNVVAGRDHIFLIDFGFATAIQAVRQAHFYSADRTVIAHQPPELFFDDVEEKKACVSQDIYSLGFLLSHLLHLFHYQHSMPLAALSDSQNKISYIVHHMTCYQPAQRWSIEKSIYMLSIACLSSLSKTILYRAEFANINTSHAVFDLGIQVRIDELTAEQAKRDTPLPIKEKKIMGLKNLQRQIADKPSEALEAVRQAKKNADLVSGVFLHRTEILLSELIDVGSQLGLLH